MTDWKPGDPLYNYLGVFYVNPIFDFRSCDPEDGTYSNSEARWSPEKGWWPDD